MSLSSPTTTWVKICSINSIVPFTGVAALVDSFQIAVFRLHDDKIYAISNYDPFSKAFVLSRGTLGDRKGEMKIASPVHKQSFSLITGQCLDDPAVKVPVYPTRVVNGTIYVGVGVGPTDARV
jgi:nitrite reductase (NADH) small subunit